MEENIQRPPLGLKPRHIHDRKRMSDIKEAIVRYLEAGCSIPIEWIIEYNELVEKIPIEEREFIESLE